MSHTVCRLCDEILEQGHALCLGCHRDFDAVAPRFEEPGGERFAGYRLEKRIGKGGHGEVWRAHHLLSDQHVALKRLRPELRDDPLEVLKFRKEIQLHSRFRLGNVVSVLGAAQYGGWYYYTMPLMEGDLNSRLDRYCAKPILAAKLVGRIARSLQQFHDDGSIHQDIHPGNILFDKHDTPFLSDFGEAQEQVSISSEPIEKDFDQPQQDSVSPSQNHEWEEADGNQASESETASSWSITSPTGECVKSDIVSGKVIPIRATSDSMGATQLPAAPTRRASPANRAPEQRIGGGRRTRAIDIYQMGVLLGFLASQRHPRTWQRKKLSPQDLPSHQWEAFKHSQSTAVVPGAGESLPSDGFKRHLAPNDGLIAPEELDPTLRAIVDKCLEPDWLKRLHNYDTASAFANDLDCYCKGLPTRALPPGRIARAWSNAKLGKGWILSQLGVLLLVTIAFVAFRYWEEQRDALSTEQLVREDAMGFRETIELQLARYAADVSRAATEVDIEALRTGDEKKLLEWSRRQEQTSVRTLRTPGESGDKPPFDRWYILDSLGFIKAIFPPKNIAGIKFFERDYFQGPWRTRNQREPQPYISRAFEATCDHVFKFAISAAVLDGEVPLGVAVATVPADSNLSTLKLRRHDRNVMIVAQRDKSEKENSAWKNANNCGADSSGTLRIDRPWQPYLLMVHPALQATKALPLPGKISAEAEPPLWEMGDQDVRVTRSFVDPLLGTQEDVSDLLQSGEPSAMAQSSKDQAQPRIAAAARLRTAPMVVVVEAKSQPSRHGERLLWCLALLLVDFVVIAVYALLKNPRN